MKSVMDHRFSNIPQVQIPRSVFDRSHGYKTTFDADYLIPVYVDEALPGDTFKADMTVFARLATPLVPMMDNLYLDMFFFAVPNRLVWANWEHFNGARDGVTDYENDTDYIVPCLESVTVTEGSLADYMGLPIGLDCGAATQRVNALPFRAYNLIYNEWFRDQNLIGKATVNVDDGPDVYSTDYELKKRAKKHDYFTSALPWPQKGPGVELPLGTEAPVIGDGNALGLWYGADKKGLVSVQDGSTRNMLGLASAAVGAAVGSSHTVGTGYDVNKSMGVINDPDESGLIADLSEATAATINTLRQAFQLQRLYERDARGGTRYTEIIRSHFGVISPDFRLQRPEFLGGSTLRININPVQQTSVTPPNGTGNATPIGHLAAYGQVSGRCGFTKSFTEHSYIIGIANIRADLTYQQGLNRMWSRQTRWDFYWPSLAHLGEQAIKNKEIFIENDSTDEEVFGYQERWAEYRYYPSQITGLFRSDATGSLDVWHLSEDFSALPALNQNFIESNLRTVLDRCIAVPSEPQMIFDSYMQLHCARPMPVYSVPGLIDHF